MISFARHRLADVAASIKLPVPPDSPDVTILIPAYNHIVTTLECIASIAAHTDGNAPSFEVLEANDGPRDETAQVLARLAHPPAIDQPDTLGSSPNYKTPAHKA